MFTAEAPTRGVRHVGSSWPHLPQSFSFSRVFPDEAHFLIGPQLIKSSKRHQTSLSSGNRLWLPQARLKRDGRRQKLSCFGVFNGRRPLATASAREHQSRTRLAIQEKRNRYGAQPGILSCQLTAWRVRGESSAAHRFSSRTTETTFVDGDAICTTLSK